MSRYTCLSLSLLSISVAACGSAAGDTPVPSSAGGAAGAGGGSAGAGAGGDAGAAGAGGGGVAGSGGSLGLGGAGGSGMQAECATAQATAEVFGHSASDLYRLDPNTLSVTHVGAFSCLGGDSMIDIAIDKTGVMYGTAFGGFVTIDKATGKCSFVAMGSYPNSLSVVPAGTVSPTDEALVGYQGSSYVRIDPKTGGISTIGDLGGGYTSSGDIVSVIGGGTYLTVKGNGCDDCVVRVDPKTGALAEVLGPAGYTDVFGVAYWAGVLYGFTSAGELFAYDVTTKKSKPVKIANAPGNLSFYGAGSTTCAPAAPNPGLTD